MILLIDNYDSFTYNLYQYLGSFDEVMVMRNDQVTSKDVISLAPKKIVISPGPKAPLDAGNCISIIKDLSPHIPILGICLGHQCIGHAFGAHITYAKDLYHGKTSLISHQGNNIFESVPSPVKVTRYHSLIISPESLPDCFDVLSTTEGGDIMAIAHKHFQTIGLQFHPESISTDYGMEMLENFVKMGDSNA